jgi:hypothetical protein
MASAVPLRKSRRLIVLDMDSPAHGYRRRIERHTLIEKRMRVKLSATIARLAQLRPCVVDRRWRVHQGVDMGRPSLLLGRTTIRNGDLESVHVGGTCVAVMQGTFTLSGDDQRKGTP